MSERHEGCGAHAGLPTDLRAHVLTALDRVEPVLDRVREGPPTASTACTSCPVCALLAVLQGERPEAVIRLAEQASGLLTALRAALEDGAPTTPAPPSAPARPVQRITVDRVRTRP